MLECVVRVSVGVCCQRKCFWSVLSEWSVFGVCCQSGVFLEWVVIVECFWREGHEVCYLTPRSKDQRFGIPNSIILIAGPNDTRHKKTSERY